MNRSRLPDSARPTMRHVAEHAGVSLKTVSRVVNNVESVSPDLAERVRGAIDELGFLPNAGARILRSSDRRTASIALLLEDLSNPFCASVQRAVESEATPRHVLVFSASEDEDPEREREMARAFLARRADGLLLTPTAGGQQYLRDELHTGTAIVCIDREPVGLDVDHVVASNADGVRDGMRHLAGHGHRRIAYIGGPLEIYTFRERFRGYRETVHELGLAATPDLVVHGVRDEPSADRAASALLDRPEPPTAIMTGQNLATIGTVRVLHRRTLEHSVALVGFDELPMADLVRPAITVIAQDAWAVGSLGAQMLFDRIAGNSEPARHRVVPTTLVPRGSGEIRPPDPP